MINKLTLNYNSIEIIFDQFIVDNLFLNYNFNHVLPIKYFKFSLVVNK